MKQIFLLMMLLVSMPLLAGQKTVAERANVLFILTDDQRGDAVGYHQQSFLDIKTPNIDRLAEEGGAF